MNKIHLYVELKSNKINMFRVYISESYCIFWSAGLKENMHEQNL